MKAKDVRKGNIILYNNQPYKVMDFHHHTPGNLRAMVQTKLRHLMNGSQTEVRFSSTEDLKEADVFTFDASYLYHDSAGYHFMNTASYEEVTIEDTLVGDSAGFFKDGMVVTVMNYNGSAIGITLPPTVVMEIVECEPGLKGATVTNVQKPAKTDTGLQVSVPPFIKIGDRITVSTEDGKYMSRAD